MSPRRFQDPTPKTKAKAKASSSSSSRGGGRGRRRKRRKRPKEGLTSSAPLAEELVGKLFVDDALLQLGLLREAAPLFNQGPPTRRPRLPPRRVLREHLALLRLRRRAAHRERHRLGGAPFPATKADDRLRPRRESFERSVLFFRFCVVVVVLGGDDAPLSPEEGRSLRGADLGDAAAAATTRPPPQPPPLQRRPTTRGTRESPPEARPRGDVPSVAAALVGGLVRFSVRFGSVRF
mmetsp:Transcript_33997/g.109131  ORF Transcript_33997/g.109131 Transcript_33997/m.109131 type:complete len:236 (+) Transcript_33997:1400-2107(+)